VTDPVVRAKVALEGLSVGDALGQRFFFREIAEMYGPGAQPPGPWWWTDDTNMALSIVDGLLEDGQIAEDRLALSFAARFDPGRQYGEAMYEVVPRLARETWRQLAASLFDGRGSYGNGAAMRVAPLGAFFADDLDRCVTQAEQSAIVTHTHPDAIAGAIAVAVAASVAASAAGREPPPPDEVLSVVLERTPPSEVRERIDAIRNRSVSSASAAAKAVGNGSLVSAADTVPFAVWCAARFLRNYEQAVWSAISTGGDMDTLAAIVGGITASYTGLNGIPERWRAAREPLPAGFGVIDPPG